MLTSEQRAAIEYVVVLAKHDAEDFHGFGSTYIAICKHIKTLEQMLAQSAQEQGE